MKLSCGCEFDKVNDPCVKSSYEFLSKCDEEHPKEYLDKIYEDPECYIEDLILEGYDYFQKREQKYTSEDLNKMFQYLEKFNIVNDFVKSLRDQWNERKSLSDRQGDCLYSTVSKHKSIRRMFDTLICDKGIDWFNKQTFLLSINKQFDEKNYLSYKQLEALKKNANKCIDEHA